jgi:hypothetical protein
MIRIWKDSGRFAAERFIGEKGEFSVRAPVGRSLGCSKQRESKDKAINTGYRFRAGTITPEVQGTLIFKVDNKAGCRQISRTTFSV